MIFIRIILCCILYRETAVPDTKLPISKASFVLKNNVKLFLFTLKLNPYAPILQQ